MSQPRNRLALLAALPLLALPGCARTRGGPAPPAPAPSMASPAVAAPAPPVVLDDAQRAARDVQAAQGRYWQDKARASAAVSDAGTARPAFRDVAGCRALMAAFASKVNDDVLDMGGGNDYLGAPDPVIWPYGGDDSTCSGTMRVSLTHRLAIQSFCACEADHVGSDQQSELARADVSREEETLADGWLQTMVQIRLDSGYSDADARRCSLLLHDPNSGDTITVTAH